MPYSTNIIMKRGKQMPANIVVGTQWGDEGKGKVIDILASRADVVVRSQGGNNAGHTVVNNGEVYKLHLIPSGILYPNTLCLIGAGVVLDPKDFIGELDSLAERGIVTEGHLKIDPRAHIVMPWHITLDGLSEAFRGGKDIGTTKRGIGPTYMDKYERCGIRMFDLVHPELLAEKIQATGKLKNKSLLKFTAVSLSTSTLLLLNIQSTERDFSPIWTMFLFSLLKLQNPERL